MSGADWESALVTALLADTALGALVGAGVDWDERPQVAALPAVVLTLVSDVRTRHMKGENGFRESRVQADCFAFDSAQAVTVREGMIAAMEGIAHTVQGGVKFNRIAAEVAPSGIDRSAAEKVYRQTVDFLIWHN